MLFHFELWRLRHAQLSRELRDTRYLLTPRVDVHFSASDRQGTTPGVR